MNHFMGKQKQNNSIKPWEVTVTELGDGRGGCQYVKVIYNIRHSHSGRSHESENPSLLALASVCLNIRKGCTSLVQCHLAHFGGQG